MCTNKISTNSMCSVLQYCLTICLETVWFVIICYVRILVYPLFYCILHASYFLWNMLIIWFPQFLVEKLISMVCFKFQIRLWQYMLFNKEYDVWFPVGLAIFESETAKLEGSYFYWLGNGLTCTHQLRHCVGNSLVNNPTLCTGSNRKDIIKSHPFK